VPAAWRCLRAEAAASLNLLLVPQRSHHSVRTSTLVEQADMEERRRTTVIPPLWGETSLVNLVFGVVVRVSDRGSKKCLRELEQQPSRSLHGKLTVDDQEVSTPSIAEPLSRRRAASAA